MPDVVYPLYPVVAGIGCVLVAVPFPWHAEAWNSGTCFFMAWTSLACFNQLVNSVVWHGTVLNLAPVWCEISTRIIICTSVGIPAATLCISRRLYSIARCQTVSVTRSEKRRAVLVDTAFCVLSPLIYTVMAYIVQGHRFDIYEEIGCYPAIYNTLPAYFLVFVWPVVLGLASAVYSVLSIQLLTARRAELCNNVGSCLTNGRYLRLMALAMVGMVFTTCLGVYQVISNIISGPIQPWVSWDNVHYDFSRVNQYPAVLWRSVDAVSIPLQFTQWLTPVYAFIFFAFFGFAEEARKQYRSAYDAVLCFVNLFTSPSRSRSPSKQSRYSLLPVAGSALGVLLDGKGAHSSTVSEPTINVLVEDKCTFPKSVLHASSIRSTSSSSKSPFVGLPHHSEIV